MNKTILAIAFATILAGCGGVAPIKMVTVDKPIPMCPKPPEVPVLVSQVDQLTEADVNDPGKVGMAYKYDMTFLRTTNEMYRMILGEYTKTSQNFDAVTEEINKSFKAMDQSITDAQKPKTP